MEREHVSILMCRKLCGCKSGRIDDDKEPSPSGSTYSIINPGHDPVCVLVASHRIIARGLLGALLAGELYVSENKAKGRKDHKLWFGAPVITAQPGVIVEEPVVAESKEGPIAEHPAEIEVQNHLPAADEELVQDLGDALPEEMPEAKDAETPAVILKKEETAA
ncbi:unnamed protein product, partial [Mesorhabditis spiculigera]